MHDRLRFLLETALLLVGVAAALALGVVVAQLGAR